MQKSMPRLAQRHRRVVLALPALAATAATLAACGSGSSSGGGAAASPSSAAPAAGTALEVRSTSLGPVLTDGKGFTLYAFEADKGTMSNCTGGCATAWPPATVAGTASQLGTGVKQSLVAQTTRADGTRQLTYAGHPLYRFVGDTTAGSTNGQGKTAFGARWDVLMASGHEVTAGQAAAAPHPAAPKPSHTAGGSATNGIPQNGGGDGDADNSGGPSDGDGNI
jgi:predicted lipoprotein with Yx(FWY)xxD motif